LILKEKEPIKEIERLQQLAGLSFLSPHLKVSLKTRKLLSSVTKEIQWFRKACPQRRRLDTWLMYFIALLDRIGIKGVKGILRKLALRRGEEKRALSYKKISRKLVGALSKAEVQASQIFDLLEPLSYEVALLVKAKYKNYFLQRHIQDFLKVYNGTRISVCGRDLRDLGLSPGPYYQKIFAKVLKAKLDGLLKSRGEEVELIRKLIKNR
jgi:tRNA nucleotidyltransferase (CCA-adding enzyme)